MSSLAIGLLVVSAVLHAGWNLLSKRSIPTASFFLLANAAGGLLLLPVWAVHWEILPLIPARVWGLLALTGAFQAVYYAALAGAYRAGDVSVAYPLARSSPVIVVTVVTIFLGRGHEVSPQCIAGIVLVVAGCFLVPMRRFADVRWSNYASLSCGLALLAAAGTAGYSLCDDAALRALRSVQALAPTSVAGLTLSYAALEAASSSLWLLPLILLRRQGRATLRTVWGRNRRQAVVTGAMIYVTYSLVLVSMGHVSNVSYVVAFRQLSVPLGALLAIVLLHEPAHRPKLLGVLVMFAGLVLVGTG